MTTGWTWDATLFEGSAPYYDRGRLPYAPGLAQAMAHALDLDGNGRLLDVGCGPGTIALRLAHLFEEAVGVDADEGMLTEAERLAEERGFTNARWAWRRAEELPADLGLFRVVTFAASFHWMDQPKVAAAVLTMLEPRGALVHVDNHHQDGLPASQPLPFPPLPDDAVLRLRTEYLGPQRRAGQSVRETSQSGEDDVFRAAGFRGPERVRVPDGRVLERTIDDIVANTFSSSATAPHLFGPRLSAFERDLRAALATASPAGRFAVQLPDNELKIWRPE